MAPKKSKWPKIKLNREMGNLIQSLSTAALQPIASSKKSFISAILIFSDLLWRLFSLGVLAISPSVLFEGGRYLLPPCTFVIIFVMLLLQVRRHNHFLIFEQTVN
ncbi:hypothetical protein ES332_A07G037300v1 [Gossypium tomentosum]|uniref:Uncharacterized protein n=1 Tax=Gossypium tomentosum TaxID=34277 RepID=A0A5D2PNG8_GOSTO|nr:hypothetical protein ES332_A07G037300v1 [Gossypium tomentosum]